MGYRFIRENVIEYVAPSGVTRRACARHVYVAISNDPKRERCTECKLERNIDSDI